ncbi:MAG: hypothetical protein HC847_06880 [Hydrococcus sp. RU_2_2]|jgi:hypothetical protein|nr:hypothetical protein [Hydrococcus sp. RU_2_2]NJP19020.1 hypothetical protein [Hydrococcus sp. CRU_1_1]
MLILKADKLANPVKFFDQLARWGSQEIRHIQLSGQIAARSAAVLVKKGASFPISPSSW